VIQHNDQLDHFVCPKQRAKLLKKCMSLTAIDCHHWRAARPSHAPRRRHGHSGVSSLAGPLAAYRNSSGTRLHGRRFAAGCAIAARLLLLLPARLIRCSLAHVNQSELSDRLSLLGALGDRAPATSRERAQKGARMAQLHPLFVTERANGRVWLGLNVK
jgi:hypothetical protein